MARIGNHAAHEHPRGTVLVTSRGRCGQSRPGEYHGRQGPPPFAQNPVPGAPGLTYLAPLPPDLVRSFLRSKRRGDRVTRCFPPVDPTRISRISRVQIIGFPTSLRADAFLVNQTNHDAPSVPGLWALGLVLIPRCDGKLDLWVMLRRV